MNETISTAASRLQICEAERAPRLKAVSFARGSVHYEGGIQTDEVEAIATRYVAGELTLDEYRRGEGVRYRAPRVKGGATLTCGVRRIAGKIAP